MERKFECHMTFHVDNAPWVKAAGEANGFKYSQIDGDAKMGPKPWCYLTAYAPTGEALKERMWEVEVLLEAAGVATLRKKIEEIVYDTKTGDAVSVLRRQRVGDRGAGCAARRTPR